MRPRWGRIAAAVSLLGLVAWVATPLATPAPPRAKCTTCVRRLELPAECEEHPWICTDGRGSVFLMVNTVDPELGWVVLRDGEERLRLGARETRCLELAVGEPGTYTVYLARGWWPVSNVLTWKQ